MSLPTFGQLLAEYMTRSGISDSELARSIGVRRQTIFRWKEGLVERPRSREDVLQCAKKLRLTTEERDRLLLAAGFAPEQISSTVLPPSMPAVIVPLAETSSPLPAPPVDAEPTVDGLSDEQEDRAEQAAGHDTRTAPLITPLDSIPVVDIPVDDRPVTPGSSPLAPLAKPADESIAVVTEALPDVAAKPASPLPLLLTGRQRWLLAGGVLLLTLFAFLWVRTPLLVPSPTPTAPPPLALTINAPPQTTPTRLPDAPVAAEGETLLLIAQFKGYTPGVAYNVAGRISEELGQQITTAGLISTTVIDWSKEITNVMQARDLLTAANATMVIWGEYDSGRVRVNLEARDAKASKSHNFTLTPGDELMTTINDVVPKDIRDMALLALSGLVTDRGKYQIDIARLLSKLGNVSAAAAIFEQALERNPSEPESAALLNFYLGYLTAKTKTLADYERAITYYSRALTLNEQLYDALYNRGTVRIEFAQMAPTNEALIMASLNAAITDLTAFIKVRPNDLNGYLNRGVAYYERDSADDMTAALADLNHVIAHHDRYALAYYLRGLVHIRAGAGQQWVADFEQVMGLDPKDVRAISGLCWGYVMAQQAEKALFYCDQAVQYDKSGASNDSRAIAYAQLGRYPDAIADFRVYLDSLKSAGSILTYERNRGPLVEQWITQLEAGQNPFDAALLARLRHRDHYQ